MRSLGFLKTAAFFCLTLLSFSVHARAQENAGSGWPMPHAERRESKTPGVEMISSGPVSVRMDPGMFGAKVLRQDGDPVVTPPFPVATPVAIVYPKKAVRRGWEGRTVIAAEILTDGAVGRTALAQSSGYDILDNAAQDSIKTWKFEPASDGEEAVPQFVDIPVTFKLEGAA